MGFLRGLPPGFGLGQPFFHRNGFVLSGFPLPGIVHRTVLSARFYTHASGVGTVFSLQPASGLLEGKDRPSAWDRRSATAIRSGVSRTFTWNSGLKSQTMTILAAPR